VFFVRNWARGFTISLNVAFPSTNVVMMGSGEVMNEWFADIKRVNRCGNIQLGEGYDIKKRGDIVLLPKRKVFKVSDQEKEDVESSDSFFTTKAKERLML
jgi:hypothetical protein